MEPLALRGLGPTTPALEVLQRLHALCEPEEPSDLLQERCTYFLRVRGGEEELAPLVDEVHPGRPANARWCAR